MRFRPPAIAEDEPRLDASTPDPDGDRELDCRAFAADCPCKIKVDRNLVVAQVDSFHELEGLSSAVAERTK